MPLRIAALCLVLFLSACGGNGASIPAGVAQDAGGVNQATHLPDGIVMPMRHGLRTDELYRTKAGNLRQRVIFEVLEPDYERSVEKMERALQSAGYVASTEVEAGRNYHALRFRKEGVPNLSVFFFRDVGKTPSIPARIT